MKKESLVVRGSKVLSPVLTHYTTLEIEKGRGAYLISYDGKKYLDFACGIAVTNIGHCHPKVVASAVKQTEKLIHGCAGVVYYEPNIMLAEELAKVTPQGLTMSFFCQSGTEATEAAIKLAKYVKNKPGMLAFTGGFHGRSLGALSLTTSKMKYRDRYEPLIPNVYFAPYSKDSSLEEAEMLLKKNPIAGVMVEPMLGEGGYIVPSKEFLAGLRALCDKYDAFLIFDEVQTGFGRTGKMFASEHFNVTPDIMTLAKAIASGFPLGAIVSTEEIMKKWSPGAHGGTMGGNPVSCAAGVATLDVIKNEKLVENSAKMGAYLRSKLESVQKANPAIVDVRGLGLMIGVEMKDGGTVKRVLEECLKGGLVLITSGADGQVIRFIPPLIINKEQIDSAINIFSASVNKVTA